MQANKETRRVFHPWITRHAKWLTLLLLGGSLTVAATSFAMLYVRTHFTCASRMMDQQNHATGTLDHHEWTEVRSCITQAVQQLPWLRTHQRALFRALLTGGVVSGITGLILLWPFFCELRAHRLTQAQKSLFAVVAAGLVITCSAPVIWVSSLHAMKTPATGGASGVDEQTLLDQARESVDAVRSVAYIQNRALTWLGLGACLWSIGIIALRASGSAKRSAPPNADHSRRKWPRPKHPVRTTLIILLALSCLVGLCALWIPGIPRLKFFSYGIAYATFLAVTGVGIALCGPTTGRPLIIIMLACLVLSLAPLLSLASGLLTGHYATARALFHETTRIARWITQGLLIAIVFIAAMGWKQHFCRGVPVNDCGKVD